MGVSLAGLVLFPSADQDVSTWNHVNDLPITCMSWKWLLTVPGYSLCGSPCTRSFPLLDHSHLNLIANLGKLHPPYSWGTLKHREVKPPAQGHTAVRAELGFEPRSSELQGLCSLPSSSPQLQTPVRAHVCLRGGQNSCFLISIFMVYLTALLQV